VVWVTFAVNFFGMLRNRREQHLYVAVWFYIATIITVAILHIFNSLAVPWSPLKSYSLYAGVEDAFMQWWYGHNAVAFFLTTPFLGLMYYFLPKAAERRSSATGCRSCTSGRWSSSTSGPARTTCTTPRCRSGPRRSACCSR
jgi:cbb3-type cytochrome oxidase subunit 1